MYNLFKWCSWIAAGAIIAFVSTGLVSYLASASSSFGITSVVDAFSEVSLSIVLMTFPLLLLALPFERSRNMAFRRTMVLICGLVGVCTLIMVGSAFFKSRQSPALFILYIVIFAAFVARVVCFKRPV